MSIIVNCEIMKKKENNLLVVNLLFRELSILSLTFVAGFVFMYFTYYGGKIPVTNLSHKFWLFSFVVYYLIVLVTRLIIVLVCKRFCKSNMTRRWLLIISIIAVPIISYFTIIKIF